jgi:hypothetical protein
LLAAVVTVKPLVALPIGGLRTELTVKLTGSEVAAELTLDILSILVVLE